MCTYQDPGFTPERLREIVAHHIIPGLRQSGTRCDGLERNLEAGDWLQVAALLNELVKTRCATLRDMVLDANIPREELRSYEIFTRLLEEANVHALQLVC